MAIMNRNEPLTKCKPKREKKKKKVNTCRGFRDNFNVRGFLLSFESTTVVHRGLTGLAIIHST